MNRIVIRPAEPADADMATIVLRRSITELCVLDHGNNPVHLNEWLANKTPDVFRTWLASAPNTILVAERDGAIAGVGGFAAGGEITLNYVSPDHRFCGVSTALLAALEDSLQRMGATEAELTATRTARDFYLARGYIESDAITRRMGRIL